MLTFIAAYYHVRSSIQVRTMNTTVVFAWCQWLVCVCVFLVLLIAHKNVSFPLTRWLDVVPMRRQNIFVIMYRNSLSRYTTNSTDDPVISDFTRCVDSAYKRRGELRTVQVKAFARFPLCFHCRTCLRRLCIALGAYVVACMRLCVCACMPCGWPLASQDRKNVHHTHMHTSRLRAVSHASDIASSEKSKQSRLMCSGASHRLFVMHGFHKVIVIFHSDCVIHSFLLFARCAAGCAFLLFSPCVLYAIGDAR